MLLNLLKLLLKAKPQKEWIAFNQKLKSSCSRPYDQEAIESGFEANSLWIQSQGDFGFVHFDLKVLQLNFLKVTYFIPMDTTCYF